jgi:hypothetical protein
MRRRQQCAVVGCARSTDTEDTEDAGEEKEVRIAVDVFVGVGGSCREWAGEGEVVVGDDEGSIPTMGVDGKWIVVFFFGDGGRRRSAAAAVRTRMRAVGFVDDMRYVFGSGKGKGERRGVVGGEVERQ